MHHHQLCKSAQETCTQGEEKVPQTEYADRASVQKGGIGGVNTLRIMGYGMHSPRRNGGGDPFI